jgi:hypothetical protein
LIAFSHTAGENFIRIMPGVAQAIEEVLRSGHVPRAHGRLFAIQVGGLAVVSAKRCFERASRHSLCEIPQEEATDGIESGHDAPSGRFGKLKQNSDRHLAASSSF